MYGRIVEAAKARGLTIGQLVDEALAEQHDVDCPLEIAAVGQVVAARTVDGHRLVLVGITASDGAIIESTGEFAQWWRKQQAKLNAARRGPLPAPRETQAIAKRRTR